MEKPISLQFNCGYARVAVRELTDIAREQKVNAASLCEDKFLELFSKTRAPNFGIPDGYFCSRGKNESRFEYARKKIKAFAQKWSPTKMRVMYLEQFSMRCWKDLPQTKTDKHTLMECKECRNENYLQSFFPLKPLFSFPDAPALTLSSHLDEKEQTIGVLAEVNSQFMENYGSTFIESARRHCKLPLEKKRTKAEKRNEKRKVLKECRDHINKKNEGEFGFSNSSRR